jgi:hypothetical protein
MTYASPAWGFAANAHLLKLQRLQNKVLRAIGNFPRKHTGPKTALSLSIFHTFTII